MPGLGVTVRVARLWHCVHCVVFMVRATSLSPFSGSSNLLVTVMYSSPSASALWSRNTTGFAFTGMWQAMQLIFEWVEWLYAMIVSSCTLWQPSEQNQ